MDTFVIITGSGGLTYMHLLFNVMNSLFLKPAFCDYLTR